jgi:hypothetical protein
VGSEESCHEERSKASNLLARFVEPNAGDETADPYLIAQRWLDLVAPLLEAERAVRRRAPYLVLTDINASLARDPLDIDQVERQMSDLPIAPPIERRINACILGVPD